MAATYDPFIGEPETVRSRVRNRLPETTPSVALVVTRSGRPSRVLRPPDKLTLGEGLWGSVVSIQRIDVSPRRLEFSASLPSADHIYDFIADIWVICEVDDPGELVRRGIHDALEWMQRPVTRALREVSARFQIHDPMAAERAISKEMADHRVLKDVRPFVLTGCGAQLTLDSATRDHVRRLQEDSREHERTMKRIEMEGEEGHARQSMTHKQERQRVRHDGELATTAMQTWEPILGDSPLARLLAVKLGRSPEQINDAVELLQQNEAAQFERFLATIRELEKSDLVEDAHLDKIANELLSGITRYLASPTIAGGTGPLKLDASAPGPIAETDDDEIDLT